MGSLASEMPRSPRPRLPCYPLQLLLCPRLSSSISSMPWDTELAARVAVAAATKVETLAGVHVAVADAVADAVAAAAAVRSEAVASEAVAAASAASREAVAAARSEAARAR